MTTTWILIANASEAHLYTSPRAKLLNGSVELVLMNNFSHPESRQKDSNLVADKLGHNGRGTFVDASEPKQLEADHFAKELVLMLEQGRVNNKFQDLIIAAPAKFRGMLHKYISEQLQQLLSVDINRDYTKDKVNVLIEHLQEHL